MKFKKYKDNSGEIHNIYFYPYIIALWLNNRGILNDIADPKKKALKQEIMSFPYDNNIIQFSYRSILRSKSFKNEKDFLIYLYESKKHLEHLSNEELLKNIQYWLEGVIKALESKIISLS